MTIGNTILSLGGLAVIGLAAFVSLLVFAYLLFPQRTEGAILRSFGGKSASVGLVSGIMKLYVIDSEAAVVRGRQKYMYRYATATPEKNAVIRGIIDNAHKLHIGEGVYKDVNLDNYYKAAAMPGAFDAIFQYLRVAYYAQISVKHKDTYIDGRAPVWVTPTIAPWSLEAMKGNATIPAFAEGGANSPSIVMNFLKPLGENVPNNELAVVINVFCRIGIFTESNISRLAKTEEEKTYLNRLNNGATMNNAPAGVFSNIPGGSPRASASYKESIAALVGADNIADKVLFIPDIFGALAILFSSIVIEDGDTAATVANKLGTAPVNSTDIGTGVVEINTAAAGVLNE